MANQQPKIHCLPGLPAPAAALLLGISLLVCFLYLYPGPAAISITSPDLTMKQSYLQGLYLLHGISGQDFISYAMPLGPLLAAIASYCPETSNSFFWICFLLAIATQGFAIGSALGSRKTGTLSALLLLLAANLSWTKITDMPPLEKAAMMLSTSLVFIALLLRSRSRTLQQEFLLALAIGINFMLKSPLFLLPPLLAAFDIISGKIRRGETSWRNIALLCILPYAMLLPWAYMNCALHGELILFEKGRAGQNIISGALGIVRTIEGAYSLAGVSRHDSEILWMIRTVAAHPLIYAEAVSLRIWTAFTWYPFLAVCLPLVYLRFIKDGRFQAGALFFSYYVLIHCAMSIEYNYFTPIWPAAVASAGVLPYIFNTHPPQPQPGDRYPRLIFLALLIPFCAAYLFVCALALGYPHRARPLTDALSASSQGQTNANPLLLAELASEEIKSGDNSAAYDHAKQAVLKKPSPITMSAYLSALAMKKINLEQPVRRLLTKERNNATNRLEYEFLLLTNYLQLGKKRDAEQQFAAVFYAWTYSLHLSVTTDREQYLYSRLQTPYNNEFREIVLMTWMGRFPHDTQERFRRLLPELNDLIPGNAP